MMERLTAIREVEFQILDFPTENEMCLCPESNLEPNADGEPASRYVIHYSIGRPTGKIHSFQLTMCNGLNAGYKIKL